MVHKASVPTLLTSFPVLIFVLVVLWTAELSGAKDLKIVGTQTVCFDDGRTIERYLVRDLESGEVFARKAEEIPSL